MRKAVAEEAPGLARKFVALVKLVRDAGPSVVAFSGGADSSLLAYVASRIHPETLCAVACSETYTVEERARAKAFAKSHGLNFVEIKTKELADPKFRANPPDRCYFCKTEMVRTMRELAQKRGLDNVLYGENASDADDHRPGRRAMREWKALSPLAEAGLTKEDVRGVSKALGLDTWDMPSNACLASRFAYGCEITPDRLKDVAAVERKLRSLGLEPVRARVHGDLLRIEVGDVSKANLAKLSRLAKSFKKLGFAYVALDLEGYRTGSMNEIL
jgi:uncharacterized protein